MWGFFILAQSRGDAEKTLNRFERVHMLLSSMKQRISIDILNLPNRTRSFNKWREYTTDLQVITQNQFCQYGSFVMNKPRLAICNFISDVDRLRETALNHGFSGVDWTLMQEDLPTNDVDESRLLRRISRLQPLEVRYHCAFKGMDLGDGDRNRAREAVEIFRKACRLVSKLDGRFMTIHIGLGRESYDDMVWEQSVNSLGELVCFAAGLGVHVCLENLASGWSSRPELFEKLIRMSGAGVTLDIGHARMSPSVQSQLYAFEDFVSPHHHSVINAHVYHEEMDDGHVPPGSLEDIRERLELLSALSCNWWVLELREEKALLATLEVVRGFLSACRHEVEEPIGGHWGALLS
jgi:sugar phosphate isomerase/epimerase